MIWLIATPVFIGLVAGIAYLLTGGTIAPSVVLFGAVGFLAFCFLNWLGDVLMRGGQEGVNLTSDSDDGLPPKNKPKPQTPPPGGQTLTIAQRHQKLYNDVSRIVDNADRVKVRR